MLKWGHMFPNQPASSSASSNPADYLNQIAPQAPKKSWLKPGPRLILFILVPILIIVLALAIILNVTTAARKQPLEQLTARLSATQKVVAAAQPNLKSSTLRSQNSSLNLYLVDLNSDIAEPMKNNGVNVAKLSDSIVAKESTADLTARLEEARLNARYDRTYAREMAYLLDTILTLTKQIYSTTGSASLKTFLEATYNNLEKAQQTFADFS